MGQAMRAGRRRGTWITVIVLAVILLGAVLAVVVTGVVEPDAVGMLVSGPGLVVAGPFLLVLGLLIPCWVLGSMVAAGHRLLTSAPWAEPHADAVTTAVGQLRGVTWSQTGVTGVGVIAGVLSVIFGAGLIAALFVVATTAIACARDPKCI